MKKLTVTVAAVAASAIVVGVALATIPSAGVISACYTKKRRDAARGRQLDGLVLVEGDLPSLERRGCARASGARGPGWGNGRNGSGRAGRPDRADGSGRPSRPCGACGRR